MIGEELADPKVHVAERFVGNLPRKKAPAELEARIVRRLRRPTLPRIASWFTAAAAALVIWLILGGSKQEVTQQPGERRLRVVRATTLGELDPIARGMLIGLGGVEAVAEEGQD